MIKIISHRKAPCKRKQHCWMLNVVPPPPPPPPPSLFPWSRGAMFDPFAQLFQLFYGHARKLHMVFKVLWVVSVLRSTARPNIVGSYCFRFHTTADADAATPNIVGPTVLGVVAPVRLHLTWRRTVKHSLQIVYPCCRSVRSVRIDKPYMTTLAMKIF